MTQEGISKQQYNALLIAFVFGLSSVAIGLLAILFSYKKVSDLNVEYQRLHASVSALKAESGQKPVNNTVAALDTAKLATTPPAEVTTVNEKPVTTVTEEKKTPAIREIEKKKEAVAPPKVSTRDVVVVYYHRRADNTNLSETLEGLGFNFVEKTIDKNTGYEKTNCIWYGAGVPAAVVKNVAIAMIQSGNPIKGIKRFPPNSKNPSYKRNIIEVGREEKYEKFYTRPMSIYEVENAKL